MFPPYKYIITRILRNVNKNIRKIRKNSRDFHTTKLNLPTGNLDSHTSEEVMELMQRVVREQKKTLVMVTHDDHLATYADRVFHIRDGRIIKIEDNRWKKGKEEGGRHAETNTERDRK